MKLASIVPVKNIDMTFGGEYAMLLAHLKDYYPKKRNDCYVIMDNSLIELGGAVDVDTVYEAAKQCGANEFILPDAYRDGVKTVAQAIKDIVYLRETGRLKDFNLMAVCQGATLVEFEWCFKTLSAIPDIHCIGIPKVAEELSWRGRPGLEYLWQDCDKQIHLLGCARSLAEFGRYKRTDKIRSCDTCIPALLSTYNITDAFAERPKKTIDLVNDEINMPAYKEIMHQCKEVGLV